MLSASIEDYIKTIYSLEHEHERATTQRIAQRLGVKMASVSGMMKHLASEGYVKHVPYYGAQVTEKGRTAAIRTIRRHRLIELFLTDVLGMSWDEVDSDAEELEHALSDKLVERIYEHLGRPEFDPHGSPIPRQDGSVPVRASVRLSEAPVQTRLIVVEVCDRDPEFLRHLTTLGVRIGSVIRVLAHARSGGATTISVGRKTSTLVRDAAHRMWVSVVAR